MPADLTGFGKFEWPTVEQAVERIRARNSELGALCLDLSSEALQQTAQDKPSQSASPLSGVPYSLKDVWDTMAWPTTAGSLRHQGRHGASDSALVRALSRSGAVMVGKSNVPDLAATPECANLSFGVTKNPHDITRTSGGSSGGAAAAVASGMAAFDWGSDFGGSIRLPAAFCGVVGLRLSALAWPVSGHFPFVPPELGLHGQGPLARTVAGVRQVRDALAPKLRAPRPGGFGLRGVVVLGVDDFARGEWPYAEKEISEALGAAGLRTQKVSLATPREIHHAFAALLSNHWRRFFGGRAPGAALRALTIDFGAQRLHPHTRRILAELAIANTSVYRNRSRTAAAVSEIRELAHAAFDRGLLIASPTTTFPAPPLGGAHALRSLGAFVKLGNLLDATALAIPFGRFASGMPRSLQLLGPASAEDSILDLGETLFSPN